MKGGRVASVVVRTATMDERLALENLQMRASLVWDEYREALLANPDSVELSPDFITGGRTLVAERGGQCVGFAIVLARADGDADLDGLFVEPAQWRQGIGTRLIAECEVLAAASGAQILHVVANPRALGFYRACGFVLQGETATRFGLGFAMRHRLRKDRDQAGYRCGQTGIR
jgi:GNAT superfamily N-acetyltransferase